MSDTPKYDAEKYLKYRPVYPNALYEYIFSQLKAFDKAWDCACGTGQATLKLSNKFKKVLATDISETQIQQVAKKDNITYKVSSAEKTNIEANSLDLITVAQAYHWFDHAAFALEAKRTLKPGGVLAVWGYSYPLIKPSVDSIVENLAKNILKNYWASGREYMEDRYENVFFPFPQTRNDTFFCEKQFALADLIGLLESWSARLKYIQQHDQDALDTIKDELKNAWGDPSAVYEIKFPIFLVTGMA